MRPAEAPVFEAPWQAQAFAMAVLAAERGLFSWAEWTETLGAEIARAPELPYYECWLAALERLLTTKGVAAAGELAALRDAWDRAARATPHGQPILLAER